MSPQRWTDVATKFAVPMTILRTQGQIYWRGSFRLGDHVGGSWRRSGAFHKRTKIKLAKLNI
jgi:hypothetical protein